MQSVSLVHASSWPPLMSPTAASLPPVLSMPASEPPPLEPPRFNATSFEHAGWAQGVVGGRGGRIVRVTPRSAAKRWAVAIAA